MKLPLPLRTLAGLAIAAGVAVLGTATAAENDAPIKMLVGFPAGVAFLSTLTIWAGPA